MSFTGWKANRIFVLWIIYWMNNTSWKTVKIRKIKFPRMMLHNERIILDGIREVIGSLGRFSVTEHWERVRTSNRTFDRIKENVFKKQVQQVWNKHADELKRDAQNGQRIPHQSLQPKMKRFDFSWISLKPLKPGLKVPSNVFQWFQNSKWGRRRNRQSETRKWF